MSGFKALAILIFAFMAPIAAPPQRGGWWRPFPFNLRKAVRRAATLSLAVAIASLSLVPLAQAKRVAILTGYSGASYTFGVTATNTSNFRTAALAHARNAILAVNGDSSAKGVNETAIPYNSQYSLGAMPVQLVNLLNNAGIAAGANNWYGLSGATLNDNIIRDGRLTVSGGTVLGSNKYQGGTEIRFPGVTSGATTTFNNVDTCNIIWGNQGATGRTMSYQVDSGSVNNLATSGANAIINNPPGNVALGNLGTHTLNFAWVSGGTTLLPGVNCWNSARTEISVWQMSISGGVSANMIDNTGAPGQGRIQQLTNFAPDLIITEMGLVNDWRTSVPVATSKANMTSFVTSMKAIGVQVMFLTPPFDNGSTGNVANQAQYTTAMYQVAAEQGVGLIDPQKHWLSYNNAVAHGWQYNPGISSAATITAASWSNGVATYTTSGATTLTNGGTAAVTSTSSPSGTCNGFSVIGTVTVIDSTHFSIPLAAAPGTYVSNSCVVPATDNVHLTAAGYLDEAGLIYNVIQGILQNKFAANDNQPLPIEHDNGRVRVTLFNPRDLDPAANDDPPAWLLKAG